MNRACAAIALCALLYSPLAIGQASEAGANLTKTLQSVARERILQFDRGDAKLWSPYVADGYLIATPSGRLLTREEQIASFEPPRPGYRDEFTFEDVHVRREGDTAVMSYVINEYEFWDTQKYLIPKLRKTDTYVLRNGRWLLLASQETFVPAPYKRTSVNPSVYKRYVGKYRLMQSLVYAVSVKDSNLVLEEIGKKDTKVLRPLSPNTFFVEGESAQIIFIGGRHGEVSHLLIRDNGYDIKVPRLKSSDT